MDMMFLRRRIILAAGGLRKYIVTAASGIVSFVTNVVHTTKVTCAFEPVQSGTGDPSPSNVRAISGWNGCTISHSGADTSNPRTKSINWNLPDEYQEVEYLESSGTQCINTGYKPSNNTDISLTKGQSDGTIYNYLFGACASADNQFGFSNGSYYYYGNTNNCTFQKASGTLEILSGKIYFNSELKYDKSSATGTSTQNLCLFCRTTNAGVYERFSTFALYSCKIWDSGVLVRNFIPCYRKSDNEPGLYDLVESKFYTNAGTGSFAVGSNVSTLPTYYGGTVTLNEDGSADLVEDWYYFTWDGVTNKAGTIYNADNESKAYINFYSYLYVLSKNIVGTRWVQSTILCDKASESSSDDPDVYYKPSYNYVYLYIRKNVLSELTAAGVNAYLQSNPVAFSAKAEADYFTPNTYHFSNIGALQSFIGQNAIWHDMNGSITVEYYKNE